MKIGVDKGQQAGKHEIKHKWLEGNGIELLELPLPVGDYIEITDRVQAVIDRREDRLKKMDLLGVTGIAVDTKKDLQEVTGNICGRSHARFRDQVILAQENNIKLYILVEHGGKIKSLEDVKGWNNPRQYLYERNIRKKFGMPKGSDFQEEVVELKSNGAKINRGPTTGQELYKAINTMQDKYGVEFVFCDKRETGKRIVELLGGSNEKD